MQSVVQQIEAKYKKSQVVDVKSGDTVRVHQKIREGGKERVQIFEGLVIRVGRQGSLASTIAVRRIASGVGVEKTFLLHSPSILKVEITKRSKVRRNYLTYMRARTGKSARMVGMDFDKEAVNAVHDEAAEAEEAKLHDEAEANYDAEASKKAKEEEKAEAQAQEALAAHDATKTEAEKIEEQPVERAEAKGPAAPQNKT